MKRSGTTSVDSGQDSRASDSSAGVSTGSDQSISSTETESYEETSTWKRHRTRMIGKAKGKLVVFEDVQTDFAIKMSKAIAGFF